MSQTKATCVGIKDLLGRLGDRWTLQVLVALDQRPHRFNEIVRDVDGISQQMLARTLKAIESEGLVVRTVYATKPPQVQYELTNLGRSLLGSVKNVADWFVESDRIVQNERSNTP